MAKNIIAGVQIPEDLDCVDEIERAVGLRQLQHRAVGNQILGHPRCRQRTHLGTRLNPFDRKAAFEKASHVCADAASDVEAMRARGQPCDALIPRAIDQMPAVAERGVVYALAGIFGRKCRSGFVVNFDGSPACPFRVRIHSR
jgi:hypothetical protein